MAPLEKTSQVAMRDLRWRSITIIRPRWSRNGRRMDGDGSGNGDGPDSNWDGSEGGTNNSEDSEGNRPNAREAPDSVEPTGPPPPGPNSPSSPALPINTPTPASVSTAPTVVFVTTPAAGSPSSSASRTAIALIPVYPTPASMSIAATTMMVSTHIQPVGLEGPSNQLWKAFQPGGPESNRSFNRLRTRFSSTPAPTATETMMVTPLGASLPTATGLLDLSPPDYPRRYRGNQNRGLSHSTEWFLVAIGAIGAFIIVLTGLFLLLRMKGNNVFGKVSGRKVRKGEPSGVNRSRRNSDTPSEAPPQYNAGVYDFNVDEKKYPDRNRPEGSFAPSISPAVLLPLAIPETPAIVSRGESSKSRQPLIRNAAPFGVYSPEKRPIADLQASYNAVGRRTTLLTRQMPVADNTVNTQSSFLNRDLSSNSKSANQAAQNRMSYMSSLSSGFGDGLIIPDPSTPGVPMQGYRQSRPPGTFSWMQGSMQEPGDRSTIYTTTSVESTPRFRTVNSWVAQQATRVQIPSQDIPDVPAIPLPLQTGIQNTQHQAAAPHQRNLSEDPVFKFHPGDEVQVSRGSRVPSEILNTKTGIYT